MTIDIAAIRRREQAATSGPWRAHTTYPHTVWQGPEDADDPGIISTTLAHEVVADAEFVAHARQDIPALLAELDRVRADLAAAHNHAHRQDTEIQRLTRDGIAYANENARLRSKLADLEDVGRCDHDAGLDVECRPCLVETYGQREAEVAR